MKLPQADEILKTFEGAGFPLHPEGARKFETYLRELIRWNRTHNLTSVREPSEIIKRHFLDSLRVFLCFERIGIEWRGRDVADVGSGAGFPGCPLKIYIKDFNLCLIESNHKRCAFLEHLGALLGENWTVICKRAEDVDRKFDIVVTRALDRLEERVSLLESLSGDYLLIMKGRDYEPSWAKKHGFEVCITEVKGIHESHILWKKMQTAEA